MDSVSSGSSLQFLSKLLHDAQEDDDDDDDEHVPHCSVSTMTPSSIGPVKKEATGTFQVKSENMKTIWSAEEVPEGSEFDDTWDPREQPELKSSYQRQGTQTSH